MRRQPMQPVEAGSPVQLFAIVGLVVLVVAGGVVAMFWNADSPEPKSKNTGPVAAEKTDDAPPHRAAAHVGSRCQSCRPHNRNEHKLTC